MRIAAFLVPVLVAGMSLPAQAKITSAQLGSRLRKAETLPLSERAELIVSGTGKVTLELGSPQREWIRIQVTEAGMSVDSIHPNRGTVMHGEAVGGNVDAHACLTKALDPWLLTSEIKKEAKAAAEGLRELAKTSFLKREALLAWAELLDGTWHLGHLTVDRSTGQGAPALTLTSTSTSSASSSSSSASSSSVTFSSLPSPSPSPTFLVASAHEADDQDEGLDPRESLAEDILAGGRTARALQDQERRLGGAADTREMDAFKAALRHLTGLVFENGEFRKEEAGEQEKKETPAP